MIKLPHAALHSPPELFFCSIQTWLTSSRKLQDAKKDCVSVHWVDWILILYFPDVSAMFKAMQSPPPTSHIRASDWDRSTADGSMQSRSHVLKLHLVWELVHADRLSTDCLCVCVCVPDTVAACTPAHPQPPPLSRSLAHNNRKSLSSFTQTLTAEEGKIATLSTTPRNWCVQ